MIAFVSIFLLLGIGLFVEDRSPPENEGFTLENADITSAIQLETFNMYASYDAEDVTKTDAYAYVSKEDIQTIGSYYKTNTRDIISLDKPEPIKRKDAVEQINIGYFLLKNSNFVTHYYDNIHLAIFNEHRGKSKFIDMIV